MLPSLHSLVPTTPFLYTEQQQQLYVQYNVHIADKQRQQQYNNICNTKSNIITHSNNISLANKYNNNNNTNNNNSNSLLDSSNPNLLNYSPVNNQQGNSLLLSNYMRQSSNDSDYVDSQYSDSDQLINIASNLLNTNAVNYDYQSDNDIVLSSNNTNILDELNNAINSNDSDMSYNSADNDEPLTGDSYNTTRVIHHHRLNNMYDTLTPRISHYNAGSRIVQSNNNNNDMLDIQSNDVSPHSSNNYHNSNNNNNDILSSDVYHMLIQPDLSPQPMYDSNDDTELELALQISAQEAAAQQNRLQQQ